MLAGSTLACAGTATPVEPAPITIPASTAPPEPATTNRADADAGLFEAGAAPPTPPLTALVPPVVAPAGLANAPLGPRARGFATYLNAMHNRIHPLFADEFLASLDALPAGHLLNDLRLSTALEIVLGKSGRIVRVGITRSSGVTAFDIGAVDSVMRAAPFGAPPRELVSADGNVYVGWTMVRDAAIACATMNAQPYFFVRATPPNAAP